MSSVVWIQNYHYLEKKWRTYHKNTLLFPTPLGIFRTHAACTECSVQHLTEEYFVVPITLRISFTRWNRRYGCSITCCVLIVMTKTSVFKKMVLDDVTFIDEVNSTITENTFARTRVPVNTHACLQALAQVCTRTFTLLNTCTRVYVPTFEQLNTCGRTREHLRTRVHTLNNWIRMNFLRNKWIGTNPFICNTFVAFCSVGVPVNTSALGVHANIFLHAHVYVWTCMHSCKTIAHACVYLQTLVQRLHTLHSFKYHQIRVRVPMTPAIVCVHVLKKSQISASGKPFYPTQTFPLEMSYCFPKLVS